ncbi:hypothetical protein ACOMHN_006224 [Nucella lapillus]
MEMFTRSYSADREEVVHVILLPNLTSLGQPLPTNNMTSTGVTAAGDGGSVVVVVLGVKGAVMTSIILGAVCGNLLVIASVVKHERLRGVLTNLFIVSLASADLLVAILVMPFSASVELSGRWMFGRVMCDFFNANDVLFSTASILHLCCISMDRYIAILHPLQYQLKMTRQRVVLMLAVTWVASILISYIPVYSQLYTTQQHFQALEEDPQSCVFIVNKVYAGVSSSVSFWIPCSIMLFVYAKIFQEARKQEKFVQSNAVYTHYYHHHPYTSPDPANGHGNGPGKGVLATDREAQRTERKRMKREHKAAKTLGLIMGAFILCFCPFFLWYVVSTMCGDACPCPPCCAPRCSGDFRTAFRRLLHIHQLPCHCPGHRDPDTRALDAGYSENMYLNALTVRLSHSSIMDNGQQ